MNTYNVAMGIIVALIVAGWLSFFSVIIAH